MRALLLLALAALQEERVLAIEHVAVVPMDRERVLLDHTVLVRAGRIEALAPSSALAVPANALCVDGRGRFLMPGLADMRVELWDEHELFLLVASGVTTVRNAYGTPLQLRWRERIERGELLGPRVHTAGPPVDGFPPRWPGCAVVAEPADAAGAVAAQRAAGYDLVEAYPGLSRACYAALAAACAEQGVPLTGRVPAAAALADALAARQRIVESLDGWARAALADGTSEPEPGRLGDERAWQHVTEARLAELARAVRDAGTWTCPALLAEQKWVTGAEAEALLARPEMRRVTPVMRAFWRADSPANVVAALPEETRVAARAALAGKSRAVAALRNAGAGILLGTGLGGPFVVAGDAVHEELVLLVAAGLTPFEALRAATVEPACCLDAADEWGTVSVGLAADLLLLEANPLDDVRNAARRAGVVLAGRWLSETELSAELERRVAAFGR